MSKLDYSKIFIREACPTAIGGQAVMEGVMMQGPDRVALAMRIPSGELYLRTKKKAPAPSVMKIPFIRGIVAFVNSLVNGMSTLMESADILEKYAPEDYYEEPGKLEDWVNRRFGDRAAWNFMMTGALIFAVAVSILFFIILPTWVVNFLGRWIGSSVVLNLIEGILRIVIFIGYVVAIRKMEDIKTLFRYHGAEHKSIHCFENNLELKPENAQMFYTLHPRCGTSFLVFVLIISLLLFSFLGWPSLFWRIASRLLLIPVIAGISYELLKWAGRSDGRLVRILSYPGLMLQKLTTAEPTMEQLEVGLLSLKAVLVDPDTPVIDGFVDADGNLLEDFIYSAEGAGSGNTAAASDNTTANDASAAAGAPAVSDASAASAVKTASAASEEKAAPAAPAASAASAAGNDDRSGGREPAYDAAVRHAPARSSAIETDNSPGRLTSSDLEGSGWIDAESLFAEMDNDEQESADGVSGYAQDGGGLDLMDLITPDEPDLSEFLSDEGKPSPQTDPESASKNTGYAAVPEFAGSKGIAREVIKEDGSVLPHEDEADRPGVIDRIRGIDWSKRVNGLLALRDELLSKLRLNIVPKERDTEDLWAEGSEVLGRKLPDEDTGAADEAAISEAIQFLSELDKDGYTIVSTDECNGRSLVQGIADHFAQNAKSRTLARRYTNDITTIENALKWGQAALSMIENGRNEAVMIMSYATGLTRTELITRGKELMRDDDFEVFEKRVQARLTGTPIQYILGITEFMGQTLRVNPNVLIPRLDTEVVVSEAIDILLDKDAEWLHPEVLDMCTGSGAIGITIAARIPGALVTMTDVSEAALHTAMGNAGINGVNKRCIFLLGDMFDAIPADKEYDMIICNPPYIESDVIETLSMEVRDHEPRLALDGGRDGLDYYRIIAENAGSHLRSGGYLVLEIGSDQAGSVKRLLMRTRTFDKIHKVRDLAGLDRVIIAERN